jgi:hypothetical protein
VIKICAGISKTPCIVYLSGKEIVFRVERKCWPFLETRKTTVIAMVYTFFYPTQPLWNEQTLLVDKRIVKNKRIVKTAGPTIRKLSRYNSCKNLSDYYYIPLNLIGNTKKYL